MFGVDVKTELHSAEMLCIYGSMAPLENPNATRRMEENVAHDRPGKLGSSSSDDRVLLLRVWQDEEEMCYKNKIKSE
jgi:hypothetical protein